MTHHYEVKRGILRQYTVHYACPKCGERLKSPISDAGNSDICPDCHTQFVVPGVNERTQIEQVQEVNKQEKQSAAEKRKQARLNKDFRRPLEKQSNTEQREQGIIECNFWETIDPRVRIGLIFGVLVVGTWFVSSWVNSPDKRPDTIPTKSSAATIPTKSSAGTTSHVFAQKVVEDLAAALDRGHVTIEAASGTGASSGAAVQAYLVNQRETEVSLDISLKQPMFLRNRGRGQNMIVIKVYLRGGSYKSDGFRSFISLESKLRTPVQFVAYCVDFDKDNPSNTESFIRDASPVSLLPLFQSIRNYESSHPNQDITVEAQTAIWLSSGCLH